MDPFPPHATDFALTLRMCRNYSSTAFLHFTFAQRRGAQSLYFLIHFSLSHFALQAVLTFLKGARGAEEAAVTSKSEWRLVCWFLKDPLKPVCSPGWHTDWLRAHSGFRIRWYFTDPLRMNCRPGRIPSGHSYGEQQKQRMYEKMKLNQWWNIYFFVLFTVLKKSKERREWRIWFY